MQNDYKILPDCFSKRRLLLARTLQVDSFLAFISIELLIKEVFSRLAGILLKHLLKNSSVA